MRFSMTVTLAFYKGPTGLFGRLIRAATKSPYSHVELIAGDAYYGQLTECYSSSETDGGVRMKSICLDGEEWDLITLLHYPSTAANFIQQKAGQKYDWLGILLSQVFPLARHRKNRWFCSEICAAALGFEQPHRYSPGALYELVWREMRLVRRVRLEGRSANG